MTAFTMPCWHAFERLCWLALAACFAVAAHAADKPVVERAAIRYAAAGPLLDARVALQLTPAVADALARGIAQPFVFELEIERQRRWWLNEDVFEARRRIKLGYNLLLRTWLVESETRSRQFTSLDEALAALGQLDGWALPNPPELRPGQRYEARLRLRIDTEALPKPLIIGAFTSDKWELATPWYVWGFDGPPPDKPADR